MSFDAREPAAIFAGGAVGALLRAGLVELLGSDPAAWPWPTFIANVAGAFALGYLATRLPPTSRKRPLLTTGLCGGLTTFATMQLELVRMLEAERIVLAASYASVSVAIGFLAVAVAVDLARRGGSSA